MPTLFFRIFRRLSKPSAYFRYGTLQKREFYFLLMSLIRGDVLKERKISSLGNISPHHKIEKNLGYLQVIDLAQNDRIQNAIKEAKLDLKFHELNPSINHHKHYLQSVKIRKNLDLDHPYMKIALMPEVVSIVSNYMGYIPILSDIQLWHSPNISDAPEGSQFFHLDYADISQAKLFLLVDEVDKTAGPTTFIDATISRKICMGINYKFSDKDIRISDDIVNQYCTPSKHISAVGSSGTLFFADTSRCLHYGSRHGTRPRNVLMLQYVSPFSFRYSLNFKKDAIFSHLITSKLPKTERLILGDHKISFNY